MIKMVYGLGNVFKNTHYYSSARSAGGHHSHSLSVQLKESGFIVSDVYIKMQCSSLSFHFAMRTALGF